jgi:uncharacterized protein (TIGR00297 family)
MQARILVWALTPVLCGLSVQAWTIAAHQGRGLEVLFGEAAGISLLFAVLVWRLRAATLAAALCGGLICLLVTFFTASARVGPLRSGLAPLMELFLLTFAATRAGRVRKRRAGLAEGRHGRSASQVLANLGAAGLLASAGGAALVDTVSRFSGRFVFIPFAIPILLLAVLAEATADTVSSEMGQAFGGPPVMLTTLRPVAAGTDGAVSVRGTLAGVAGAALVVAVGAWALRMQWRGVLIALVGGVSGLFFDSLLGATVERKGWLGNDLVNFASTLFAAGVALGLVMLQMR